MCQLSNNTGGCVGGHVPSLPCLLIQTCGHTDAESGVPAEILKKILNLLEGFLAVICCPHGQKQQLGHHAGPALQRHWKTMKSEQRRQRSRVLLPGSKPARPGSSNEKLLWRLPSSGEPAVHR